ncbi:hypothetical protein ME121_6810 [Methylobacterium sp. ME121]|nr:hypothetical protein ME121_6810 [Methylobacterium sp. ME121]
MARIGVLRTANNGSVLFHCPGCDQPHAVRVVSDGSKPCWGFNGDHERPAFSPSVLVTWGHHVPGAGGRGTGPHCQYGCDDPEDGNPACCGVCHSFVTDGRIQFLGDCTHALAGQTVPLSARDDT